LSFSSRFDGGIVKSCKRLAALRASSLPARSARCCSAAPRRATPCRNRSRATRGRKPKPSYSEERNTKTATVTATPTPTPKPAPIATPMPMLATAAPTPAPSTTPTNTLNGKAATPQREIVVPWLRFFPLTVIIPDTGLTRQYQSLRRFSGGASAPIMRVMCPLYSVLAHAAPPVT
jgi:hypothetical protein